MLSNMSCKGYLSRFKLVLINFISKGALGATPSPSPGTFGKVQVGK